jgi:two-component system, OmpR family, phosphate regulon sensor histidine kinase PhoR
MKAGQFSFAQVLLATALFGSLAGAVIVLRTLAGALADAGVGDAAAAQVRGALTLAVVLLTMLAVAVAALLGRLLERSLAALRAHVLERARGDDESAPPAPRFAEVAGVASALGRLGIRVAAREAELHRSAAEVAILLDAISDGILQLDGDAVIIRANPAARALLRLPATAIGQPVGRYVRHAELRPMLQRSAAGEAIQPHEVNLDDRRLFVSARPLVGHAALAGGGAVIAFVDLTELRRLESVRRDFVANVSHELKTPLTSIRGYAETLLSDDLPPHVQRQFLEVVHKNAQRLHQIVEDLLDLSRLESGGWRPELIEVNALEVVDEVWTTCADRAERRHVTFVRPDEGHAVQADPGGLRQVLSNLLDNALRHTPDRGRIEVRTWIDQTASGAGDAMGNGVDGVANVTDVRPYVVFEVRDSGTGIPSDALPRIFERFYRVDPARSRADGGTGLGLAIVKHLVESMGGSVSAESELGRGTVIRFRLPAA